jgi:hypothetical protein
VRQHHAFCPLARSESQCRTYESGVSATSDAVRRPVGNSFTHGRSTHRHDRALRTTTDAGTPPQEISASQPRQATAGAEDGGLRDPHQRRHLAAPRATAILTCRLVVGGCWRAETRSGEAGAALDLLSVSLLDTSECAGKTASGGRPEFDCDKCACAAGKVGVPTTVRSFFFWETPTVRSLSCRGPREVTAGRGRTHLIDLFISHVSTRLNIGDLARSRGPSTGRSVCKRSNSR